MADLDNPATHVCFGNVWHLCNAEGTRTNCGRSTKGANVVRHQRGIAAPNDCAACGFITWTIVDDDGFQFHVTAPTAEAAVEAWAGEEYGAPDSDGVVLIAFPRLLPEQSQKFRLRAVIKAEVVRG